jgi:hypothetical protein
MAALPTRADVNYVELHGYVGLLPLFLALIVSFTRPRKGWVFFAIALCYSLFTALGIPGFMEITSLFPGLLIGDAKRLNYLAAACLAVLFAFALDGLSQKQSPRAARRMGLGLFTLLILALGVAWLCLTVSSEESLKDCAAAAISERTGFTEAAVKDHISEEDYAVQYGFLSSTLLGALYLGLLSLVVFLFNTTGARFVWIARFGLLTVLVLDLFSNGWRFNRPVPDFKLYDEANPVVSFLKENTGYQRICRFGDDMICPVNCGAIHGIYDAQGYTAFYFKRYRRFIELMAPGRTLAYGLIYLSDTKSLTSPLLDRLGIKYILSPRTLDLPGLEEVFQRKSVWVYENTACLPKAYLQPQAVFVSQEDGAAQLLEQLHEGGGSAQGKVIIEGDPSRKTTGESDGILPVTITKYENERIELEVESGPGWLVLLDSFSSGWKAKLDGVEVPIFPADLAFRAVEIPDEKPHQVSFRYEPKSVRLGGAASVAGILLSVVLAGMFWVRGRGKA